MIYFIKFIMMVTLLVCIAHRLASSERLTRYASLASSAATAFKAQVGLGRTRRWQGRLRMRSSVLFW